MQRILALIALIFVLSAHGGCMTAAKRVFKEAKGATSKSRTFPGSPRERYAEFKGVTIHEATSEVEPLIGPEFMKALRTELVNRLANSEGEEAPLFGSGEPAFTLDARVMWYHKPGAFGDILGTNSYTVVLYSLSLNDKTIDKVEVVTKSAASRTDDADMARSSVDELEKWFESRREGKFDEDEEARREDEDRDQKKDRERRERKERKEREKRERDEKKSRQEKNDDEDNSGNDD